MGLNLWLSCFCELIHTTHTGCLSSRQKSLSFSLCKLQISSDPDERLTFLSFRNDSHKFFSTRLFEGSCLDNFLQTGHSWVSLVLQNCWIHSLQKLWLHVRRTGVLKISWHTGQEKSSSDREAIFSVGDPAIWTLLSLTESRFQKLKTTRNTNMCSETSISNPSGKFFFS